MSEEHDVTLQFGVAGAEANASYGYKWEHSGSALGRNSKPAPPRNKNQCVFLRGYMLSVQETRFARSTGLKLCDIENTPYDEILNAAKNDIPEAFKEGTKSWFSRWLGQRRDHRLSERDDMIVEDMDDVSTEENVTIKNVPNSVEVDNALPSAENALSLSCQPSHPSATINRYLLEMVNTPDIN